MGEGQCGSRTTARATLYGYPEEAFHDMGASNDKKTPVASHDRFENRASSSSLEALVPDAVTHTKARNRALHRVRGWLISHSAGGRDSSGIFLSQRAPRLSDECSQHARDHRSTPIQNNFPVPTHTHTWDEFGRILAPPDCPTRPVILSHTPHHAPRSILAVIWFRETAAGNFLAGGATFDELGRHGNLSRRGARGARWAAGGFGIPVSPFQWKAQYKMEERRRPDLLGGV